MVVQKLKRAISWLRGPSINPDDDDDPYRCIKCGTSYPNDQRVCSECGSEFIAFVGDESD